MRGAEDGGRGDGRVARGARGAGRDGGASVRGGPFQADDSYPSTRVMADAMRRHSPVSRTSSFRPVRVSV